MLRLLIVKTSSLGDIIHNLPIVADIHSHYPDMQIDWLVEESFADIPRLHPGIQNVHTVAARRWRKGLLRKNTWSEISKCRKLLRDTHYDLVLDNQGLLKSAIFASFAKTPVHGQDKDSVREPLAALFYQHKHPIPRGQHAVVRNRQLAAAALGYPAPENAPDYGIARKVKQKSRAPGLKKPYVLGLHGTSRDSKLWPTEDWVMLGRHLSDRGMNLVLPWGNYAEYQRANTIASSTPATTVLPKSSLGELIDIFAEARAAVGVDTGLAHLAVALRLPTIAIYTDTDPMLTGLHPEKDALAVNIGGPSQAPSAELVIGKLDQLL